MPFYPTFAFFEKPVQIGSIARVITVVDRGFVSEENLRTLQRAGGHYIAGEKMRNGYLATNSKELQKIHLGEF